MEDWIRFAAIVVTRKKNAKDRDLLLLKVSEYYDKKIHMSCNIHFVEEFEKGVKKIINDQLTTLSSLEEEVIRLRFLLDSEKTTIREISSVIKKPEQRTREIEMAALRKLSNSSKKFQLIFDLLFDSNQSIDVFLALEYFSQSFLQQIIQVKVTNPISNCLFTPIEIKDFKQPIEVLDLSIRPHNALRRNKISTIEDLINKSDIEIFKIRNIGAKGLSEIKEKLLKFKQQNKK